MPKKRRKKLRPGSLKGGKSQPTGRGKFGTGWRFKKLSKKLSRQGARDPDALSAAIGRAKYGNAKFQQASARGRKKKRKAIKRR